MWRRATLQGSHACTGWGACGSAPSCRVATRRAATYSQRASSGLGSFPLAPPRSPSLGSAAPVRSAQPDLVLPSTSAAAMQTALESQQKLPIAELRAMVDGLKSQAPEKAYKWMVQTVKHLEREQEDREHLMKRSWSDTAFEDGEEANATTIEGFELELVGMLRTSKQGLADSKILGNAIDLAGAYKKNYKLEKSEAVLLRCTRQAEERSGAWMVKYLNHISQVRMKQSRDVEAMEMMYEMEILAHFPMHEPGASTFYETLYRNMSSCLRRMGREDEAAEYFMKMVQASQHHKKTLDWMDLWDLGILIANRAFHTQRWEEFYKSREILAEALRQQKAVEPEELVLRAKVLSNLGQCFLATGEHDEADVHYTEAYQLFDSTVGKQSPLFGMQAWACANLRCAQGRYADALPLLGEALYVEVSKDGLSVSEMGKLLDQILGAIHEARSAGAADRTDWADLEPIQRSLASLVEDRRFWHLKDTVDLAVLAHKMALVHVAVLMHIEASRANAAKFSERAVSILRRQGNSTEAAQWLSQAQAIYDTISQARRSALSAIT